ncbi:MAG: F0F1 ATP synthase subunit delta [Terrisporobacter othiniensis]|uniref:ATP synthase subunit delta n=2 Tax=Terrisporobacter TaxID=1505652 RepID=A0AAX2ZLH6_9FIRM|nr:MULTISPECIES: F0F1 ATP synthase subunit delta [Terrisporobacter]MBN9647840.1 F0F1 ATP synthase subunit delta [Terrisporobacter glycolicus]MDU4861284.1 F0F1 ATP synthase subunit delta [Terrisporobacter othiniensis]MDU6994918.1 F0F1 ATP synthase subunit delta [Terrisporobacter othiniensis]UEL49400.1 F0F1 ATP synthase subunit delta [Terrisporobacter hibernicus]UPA30633.1 F0F1 ATP synthase subunit delta [Terrisporobacter glycolicus]
MIDIIANRYAEALFQLSEDENITKEIYNELHNVVETVKNNKDLDNVLRSPLVAKIEKVKLIESLFNNKINNNLKNFLKILVEKGRISSLKSIELTFKQLLNDKNNIIEGTVISAIPLTDEKVKELEGKLSKKYNKNVTLENKVDQSILGGVLVRLGNTQIDGSVKTRLDNIKDQLSQVIS